jgi:hypothetical protein
LSLPWPLSCCWWVSAGGSSGRLVATADKCTSNSPIIRGVSVGQKICFHVFIFILEGMRGGGVFRQKEGCGETLAFLHS